jgi:hypothetical protein
VSSSSAVPKADTPSLDLADLSLHALARTLPRGALLGRIEDVASALTPFFLYSSEQPLMRLENFVIQP